MSNNTDAGTEIRKRLENDLRKLDKENRDIRKLINQRKKENRQETLKFTILSILYNMN